MPGHRDRCHVLWVNVRDEFPNPVLAKPGHHAAGRLLGIALPLMPGRDDPGDLSG
jgi:hypothetical protein